jgi:dTDP-4-amino-4,6-dideoxygalactose transaminase
MTSKLPAILQGEIRPIATGPETSLLGDPERAALLAAFDAAAARGGFEGDEVARLERRFAGYVGAAEAVAVSSATAGLHFLLTAAGVRPGDEVLVPAHTFPASAHAVVHAGAVPVFVDIDRETLCLDPDRISEAVTDRTAAVLVVHIGGKPARMPEILAAAGRHGLVVVEDAAQAHGATTDGRSVGRFGAGGVFSFSPKLMTSFRGGIVVTDDPALAARTRELRFHGFGADRSHAAQRAGGARAVHKVPGYSAALSGLQAAVLLPQVDRLDERVAHRHANGLRLAEGLAALGGFRPVLGAPGSRGNFYMLEAFYDPAGFGGLTRDEAVTALLSEGVPVSPVALAHMAAAENPSLERFRALPHPVTAEFRDGGVVLGHPLQSLVLSGPPAYVDKALERAALVREHADRIAAHLRGGRG